MIYNVIHVQYILILYLITMYDQFLDFMRNNCCNKCLQHSHKNRLYVLTSPYLVKKTNILIKFKKRAINNRYFKA